MIAYMRQTPLAVKFVDVDVDEGMNLDPLYSDTIPITLYIL